MPGVIYHVVNPSLEIYLPEKEKASGTAVIICPGGSYKVLSYQGEGVRTAKEFKKKGLPHSCLNTGCPMTLQW